MDQQTVLTDQWMIKIKGIDSLLFGKQDWLKGEFQIKVLNLIPTQTENRLGMQRSCSPHDSFRYIYEKHLLHKKDN